MTDFMRDELGAPKIVDRSTFQAEMDALRVREKAHTTKATRSRPPAGGFPWSRWTARQADWRTGPVTLLDTFEGRRQLIAYYFMWHAGHPAPEQCEGCTLVYIAGPRAVLHSFSRRHLRHVLPRPVRRERPLPRLHGLGDALVLGPSGLARDPLGWTPGGHDAHRLLSATGIQGLRDLLDDQARRRGDGQQLSVARFDRLRSAGDVGGLAGRLAATAERRAPLPYRWTSHRPVASPEGRVFG